MMNERKVKLKETGRCPYCNGVSYSRETVYTTEIDDIFIKCKCLDCNGEFKEQFRLRWQIWE